MSDEYAPTAELVRHTYSWADPENDAPAFDRWLKSERDKAWADGYNQAITQRIPHGGDVPW